MSVLSAIVLQEDLTYANNLKESLDKTSFIKVICTTNDGQMGLDLINKYSPDIVILDLILKTMDGLEVLPEIKKLLTISVTTYVSKIAPAILPFINTSAFGHLVKWATRPVSIKYNLGVLTILLLTLGKYGFNKNIIPEASKIEIHDLIVGALTPICFEISSYFNSCPVLAAKKTIKL